MTCVPCLCPFPYLDLYHDLSLVLYHDLGLDPCPDLDLIVLDPDASFLCPFLYLYPYPCPSTYG